MTTKIEGYDPHGFINNLQAQIIQHADSKALPSMRGMLADLRHGISPGTEYRAWPHIAPWCDLTKPYQRAVMVTVAAGMATQKGTDNKAGNLGETMHKMVAGSGDRVKGLSSFDSRFRRLLSCQATPEICSLMPGILRAADRQECSVNYHKLANHLFNWSDHVKIEWAAAYWGKAAGLAEEVTS